MLFDHPYASVMLLSVVLVYVIVMVKIFDKENK
jgi:hypothetical protein